MTKQDKYQDVLDHLKEQIDAIETTGYGLKPIRDIYEVLRQRSSDITKLEQHIDAARSEIIDPVKRELAEGRLFSRLGLVIGIFGFTAAIFGTLYPVYRDNPNRTIYQDIDDKIAETNTALETLQKDTKASVDNLEKMMQSVLSRTGFAPVDASDYEPAKEEREFQRFDIEPLLDNEERPIQFRLINVRRVAPISNDDTKVMVADFQVYKGDEAIGAAGFDSYVRIESVWTREQIQNRTDEISIAEYDTIVLLDIYRFTLTKVMSDEPLGREQAENRIVAYIKPQED